MKTTYLLIGLNVAIYLLMLRVGGSGELGGFSTGTLLQFGANYGPLALGEGQWWRLINSMFIHITPLHIGMNMLALYQVGVVLEPHYGRGRYVLLYLASGIGGSLASLAWNWNHPVVSAGASGAISGFVAAGAVTGHMLLGLTKGAQQFRDSMVRWLILILGFGAVAHADNAAHLGGMVAGGGIAYLLERGGGAMARLQRDKRDGGLGFEALLLIAVVGVGFGLAARSRDQSVLPEDLINHGVELARAGKDDEAIAAYRQALKMKPNDDIGHYDLALALCRKHDFAACAVEAREATRLDPSRKESWHTLAAALAQEGKADEAAAALDEFVKRGGKLDDN